MGRDKTENTDRVKNQSDCRICYRALWKKNRNIKSPAVTKLRMKSVCAFKLLEYSGNSFLHHFHRIDAAFPHSLLSFSYNITISIAIAVVNTICFFQFQTAVRHNYGFVFNISRKIGFLRSDNYTERVSICLSREVWGQLQLVLHGLYLWPSSCCLDCVFMFKIAVPWLALSNLGSVYRGFGCKHRNGSNNARR